MYRNGCSDTGVLTAAVTAQLRQLNRDFLDLLIVEHQIGTDRSPSPNLFLPPTVARELCQLPGSALDAIARCKYTLFSLAFHATDFWCRMAQAATHEAITQRYQWNCHTDAAHPEATSAAFLSIALTFAWHLDQTDKRSARVVLALRDDTGAAFESIPLWRLPQIAHQHPRLLSPRWPDNPGFWPDLIRIARDGSASQLEAARVVGAQLIAKELEPSSIDRLSPRPPARRK